MTRTINAVNGFMDKHPAMRLAAIALMFFPLLISVIQYCAGGAIIPMGAGDMVQYYGTVGALFWAVCAFAFQREENEKSHAEEEARRILRYTPSFALEAQLKDNAILFRITNIGVHGVRDLQLEDSFLCPYLASESQIELLAMTRPLGADDPLVGQRVDGVSDGSAEWAISFGGEIRPDGFPQEVSLFAVDLLERPWRQSFMHSQNGCMHVYFAEKPVDAEL